MTALGRIFYFPYLLAKRPKKPHAVLTVHQIGGFSFLDLRVPVK